MTIAETVNAESNRLASLLLGFAAAAIAFGVHEVSSWDASVAAAVAGVAGALWAISFICGIEQAHSMWNAMRMNGAMNVAGPGHPRASELDTKFKRYNRLAGRMYLAQRLFLVAGGIVFALSVGLHLWEGKDAANDARCLAIQTDMLQARPRRHDDPALFQALRCRPKGNGQVFANEADWIGDALEPAPASEALPSR